MPTEELSAAPFCIEAPRLTIRPWQEADRGAFEAFVADPEMMRYISNGQGWSAAKVDEFMARQASNLSQHGCCMGAVEARESGRVVGVAGIQPQRLAGDFELGWWIERASQRQGLATEAARACVDHAFGRMNLDHLVAIAAPDNVASIRVMEKIGMHWLDTVPACTLEERYGPEPVVRYMLRRTAGGKT